MNWSNGNIISIRHKQNSNYKIIKIRKKNLLHYILYYLLSFIDFVITVLLLSLTPLIAWPPRLITINVILTTTVVIIPLMWWQSTGASFPYDLLISSIKIRILAPKFFKIKFLTKLYSNSSKNFSIFTLVSVQFIKHHCHDPLFTTIILSTITSSPFLLQPSLSFIFNTYPSATNIIINIKK